MDYKLTLDDARQVAAVTKKTAEFNNRPGQSEENVPLSEDEFLTLELGVLVRQWADTLCPITIPHGEWLQRWTAEERKAARMLGLQDENVQAWLDALDAAIVVHLNHPDIQVGVPAVCAVLEQIGVIAEGQGALRAAAITAF